MYKCLQRAEEAAIEDESSDLHTSEESDIDKNIGDDKAFYPSINRSNVSSPRMSNAGNHLMRSGSLSPTANR